MSDCDHSLSQHFMVAHENDVDFKKNQIPETELLKSGHNQSHDIHPPTQFTIRLIS